MAVRPKKYLGQHFLINEGIAERIVDSLQTKTGEMVLEIGPGMGVLTKYLIDRNFQLLAIEVDRESVEYLNDHYSEKNLTVIEGDFLKFDLSKLSSSGLNIIGNFPYNISSQIFFRILDERHLVKEVVCMLQKEVAQRIAAAPGSKTYGILSVLLKAFYDIKILFSVKPGSFRPPPKVDSSVIRLIRNDVESLPCDEKLFFRIVKQGFQNRRKTLRNALKQINLPVSIKDHALLDLRAEALGVEEYIQLTKLTTAGWKQ